MPVGELWVRVVPRETVIRSDHFKGDSPSTRHTTDMPAQQQSSSSGATSLLTTLLVGSSIGAPPIFLIPLRITP